MQTQISNYVDAGDIIIHVFRVHLGEKESLEKIEDMSPALYYCQQLSAEANRQQPTTMRKTLGIDHDTMLMPTYLIQYCFIVRISTAHALQKYVYGNIEIHMG